MKLRLFIHTFPPALRGRSRDVVQRRPDNKLPEYSPKNPRDPVQGNSFSKQKQHNKRRGEMGRWCCKELASERYIAEVASWCELMAVQTPTVNRESALGPVGAQPLSHLPSSPRFTTFWRGNGDSQLLRARFTTWDPRFTTWFTTFGGKMARMAISVEDRHSHGASSSILSHNIRTFYFIYFAFAVYLLSTYPLLPTPTAAAVVVQSPQSLFCQQNGQFLCSIHGMLIF